MQSDVDGRLAETLASPAISLMEDTSNSVVSKDEGELKVSPEEEGMYWVTSKWLERVMSLPSTWGYMKFHLARPGEEKIACHLAALGECVSFGTERPPLGRLCILCSSQGRDESCTFQEMSGLS